MEISQQQGHQSRPLGRGCRGAGTNPSPKSIISCTFYCGGVTQARVNQGCASIYTAFAAVGVRISLSHIHRYLVIYGMRAGEQIGSPLTTVGCGMSHKFSPSLVWKSWQAHGSLQFIRAVLLSTTEGSGTPLLCFGMSSSSRSPHSHIPPAPQG